MTFDHLLYDATLCTLRAATGYDLIEHGAIGWTGGRIAFVGRTAELPAPPAEVARTAESLGGALVTPGLVDCHTHLVFAGDRAQEFELRLGGASYEEIARAGGGIASTVAKTRAASEDELFAASLPRARDLVAEGVTTLEIKSGYGLDRDSEARMLRVARRIGTTLGITVKTTCLAAHAVPPEFRGRQGAYVDAIVGDILPALAREGLVDAVDAFCEGIGFTPDEVRRVFEAARALKLPVKLHADQLSDLGGAALVAGFDGLSADHIEWTSDAGVQAMADRRTVAVLLPGAFYCLRETKLPPLEALRRANVPIAISTDLNPGTSPVRSLLHAMNMACIQFRMTPVETLRGTTVNAAAALGLQQRKGVLDVGRDADIAVWDVASPAELSYWIGGTRAKQVYANGLRIV